MVKYGLLFADTGQMPGGLNLSLAAKGWVCCVGDYDWGSLQVQVASDFLP